MEGVHDYRRLWALLALALLAAAVVLAAVVAVSRFPRGLTVLACLIAALVVGWQGLRRRGAARRFALVISAVLTGGAVVLIVVEGSAVLDALVVASFIGSTAAAKRAFSPHQKLDAAPAPRHPVLFYNPLS